MICQLKVFSNRCNPESQYPQNGIQILGTFLACKYLKKEGYLCIQKLYTKRYGNSIR